MLLFILSFFFLFKQKTAYEMRISDWSSDVCSSDLHDGVAGGASLRLPPRQPHRRPGGAAPRRRAERRPALDDGRGGHERGAAPGKVGRAAVRGRVSQYVLISGVVDTLKKKHERKIRNRIRK